MRKMLSKTILFILFLVIASPQFAHAQVPDAAQIERLKKMAEGMKNLTPEQVRKKTDSIMLVVKKMTNLRDSMQTGVVKKLVEKLPNSGKMLAASGRQKYDTAYTTVSFSYRYTSTAQGTSANIILNGSSDNVPILSNGNSKRIDVWSVVPTIAGLYDKMAQRKGVSKKYAAGVVSLTGSGSYAFNQQEDGGYIHEKGNTLSDTAGLHFSFVYDDLENLYTAGVIGGIAFNGDEKDPYTGKVRQYKSVKVSGAGVFSNPAAAKIIGAGNITSDPDGPVAIFTKTATGFTVTYSKSKTETNANGSVSTSEFFSAYIGIPQQQYEAVIKPFERGGFSYRKWLPHGPKTDHSDDTKGDDSLRFYIQVRDKNDTTKIFHGNYTTNWALSEVTKYPGFCNNYPKYSDNPNVDPDLKFDSLMVDDPHFDPNQISDAIAVTNTNKGADALLHVICMDYAAYGKLKATVTLDNGIVLNAISNDTKKSYLSIPIDNNNNKIADAWEKAEDVFGNNYAANWDEDDLPENLGQHKGDGYTLLEEYRGFSAKKEHFRSSAKTKDLMVCDMIGERSKDGIALFKDVTKVKVHDDFELEEFGRETKNFATEGLDHDKCLNFNYTPETHSVDQHGIALVKSLEKKGYAMAVTKIDSADIGTPKRYKYLEITLDFDPGPEGYNIVKGKISNASTATADATGKAKIISDSYAHTVAHEMLHCCNVKHHGAGDHFGALLIAGKYLSDTINRNGIIVDPYIVYLVVGGTLYDPSVNGRTEYEDEWAIGWNDIDTTGIRVNVGRQGGQHSGFEDCIMRYRAASAYYDKNNHFYLIREAAGYYTELAGIQLCTNKTGTGVNAKDNKPRPRYGDATEGNCRKQFCINDKYDPQK